MVGRMSEAPQPPSPLPETSLSATGWSYRYVFWKHLVSKIGWLKHIRDSRMLWLKNQLIWSKKISCLKKKNHLFEAEESPG